MAKLLNLTPATVPNYGPFLRALLDAADKNLSREKNGYRYEEGLQKFATYLYTMIGRQSYEVLSGNAKGALPSVESVLKYSQKYSKAVIEGEFRWDELKTYLSERGLPLVVWLGEDGTRLIPRLRYDVATNQVIGFVPPLDANGLPALQAFPASSYEQMKEYFVNGMRSTYGYLIMAQPVSLEAPPFCLALFGSDNCFDFSIVIKRWSHMIKEGRKRSIEVLGLSSDADTRLLKAMRVQAFQEKPKGLPDFMKGWFYQHALPDVHFIQDVIHILTKMKSRLLTPSLLMPAGHFVISSSFIRILIETMDKQKHGLVLSDLKTKDKMKFKAIEKMCQERVLDCLEKVPGSDGTRFFLTVAREILESFTYVTTSPLRRVYLAWKTVFKVRLWREWLQHHEEYTVSANFLTSSTYICIELNAHALLQLVRKLRDAGQPELLLISLFNSQQNENTFGRARSLTTMEHTALNFDMAEFLRIIRKLDLLAEIQLNLQGEFSFPRREKAIKNAKEIQESLKTQCLPSDEEIQLEIGKARRDALQSVKQLGMVFPENHKIKADTAAFFLRNDDVSDQEDDDEVDEDAPPVPIFLEEDNNLAMPPVFEGTEVPVESPFTIYKDLNGNLNLLRKSTVLWILSEGYDGLSNDRLLRVRGPPSEDETVQRNQGLTTRVEKKEEVWVGDWVIFRERSGRDRRLYREPIAVQVLGFKYLSGASQYRFPNVTITPPVSCKAPRGIGCLGVRYDVSVLGFLKQQASSSHDFIDLKHYVCTAPMPDNVNGKLKYRAHILSSVPGM